MSRRPTAPLRTRRTTQPTTQHPPASPPRKAAPRPTAPRRPPPSPPVVSSRSAALFAARARARRWLSWRPIVLALGVLAVLAVLAWVVVASPVLAARNVTVVGASRLDPATVRSATAPVLGTPLPRVDTQAVAEEVSRMPLVKDVRVVRAWPSTLEVRLVERVPLVAVPAAGRFRLVDADGVVVEEVDAPPGDLPVVDVELASTRPAALLAATDVLSSLPDRLRADVESVRAATADDVRFRLRGGAEVVWGGASENELKSRVLTALRSQPADVYDVSAPLHPVTR